MKALISPDEIQKIQWIASWENVDDVWQPQYETIEDCQRVAQVAPEAFEVAPPLHWVDCPDDCAADEWYYKNGQLHKKPEDAPNLDQPIEE